MNRKSNEELAPHGAKLHCIVTKLLIESSSSSIYSPSKNEHTNTTPRHTELLYLVNPVISSNMIKTVDDIEMWLLVSEKNDKLSQTFHILNQIVLHRAGTNRQLMKVILKRQLRFLDM